MPFNRRRGKHNTSGVYVMPDLTIISREKMNSPEMVDLKDDCTFFHSKREAIRWTVLVEMERRGEITKLERQVKFPLQATSPAGLKITITNYILDFRYTIEHRDGCLVETRHEDSKGWPNDIYPIKKKWVEAQHGIVIHEV